MREIEIVTVMSTWGIFLGAVAGFGLVMYRRKEKAGRAREMVR